MLVGRILSMNFISFISQLLVECTTIDQAQSRCRGCKEGIVKYLLLKQNVGSDRGEIH